MSVSENTYIVDGSSYDLDEFISLPIKELIILAELLRDYRVCRCVRCERLTVCMPLICKHYICLLCIKDNIRVPCSLCPEIDSVDKVKEIFGQMHELLPELDPAIIGKLSNTLEKVIKGDTTNIEYNTSDMSQLMSEMMKGLGQSVNKLLSNADLDKILFSSIEPLDGSHANDSEEKNEDDRSKRESSE
jgi:hypothetical protein